jgi:hypothetical protein
MALPLAILLSALALPGVAGTLDIDGTYRLAVDGDCARIGEPGGALKIEDGVLTGVDSTCRMTNPVNVRDMDAQLFDMACSGEGLDWVERAMVMRAADGGVILVWNGYAFAYDRCADPADTDTAAAE